MPRGGHMGLWKPTPKDIFKSRWKRFYKRTVRLRGKGNNVDFPGPHKQGPLNYDVPSPWKFHYSLEDMPERKLSRVGNPARLHYEQNLKNYIKPLMNARGSSAVAAILRSLDTGRRSSDRMGLGRLEAGWGRAKSDMEYIKDESHIAKQIGGNVPLLWKTYTGHNLFQNVRLYSLCEEEELVWKDGLNDPRRQMSEQGDSKNRGRFPYIDEKAGLIDELTLRDILRLGHRTNSRRHPKWKELQFWYKKWHRQYLRRRQMLKDEVKARMGVLKQAIPE
eukprot:TRINITY_DN71168_c0_g1_i1.p1 TRINITY_DN71168_c0_g1~~TRINITY_DN71168_c0_g1_i1.p1  ORF type:complete len:277 (-),score=33.19 TRINITY_DN71168_c0_g1_i1:263-1093(-)